MNFIGTGPLYVSWNYTYACNFNCSHCYSRAEFYPPELSTYQYEQVVEQFIQARVMKVGLGGGEPLIRRDCIPIIEKMAAAGIDTNVTTNGWLVDEKVAEALGEVGLGTLYVSLDSSREEEHDSFRNKKGSYQRVLKAIRAAKGAGLQVRLSTVITAINIGDLADVAKIGEDLQIQGVEFKRFRPSGNGLKTKEQYQLRQDQDLFVEKVIKDIDSQTALEVALIYGAESTGEVDSGCPCGSKSICVRPNGDVSPCAYGEEVIGNLMEQKLSDLWIQSPELKLMREGGGCIALRDNARPSNPTGKVWVQLVR